MLKISSILVPYDFSPFSRQALISALHFARVTQSAVHVLHVEIQYEATILDSSPMAEKIESLKKHVESEYGGLDALRDVVDIYFEIDRDVAPGPSILQYAEEKDVDLIVMGTHGRRGIKRMFLGSVAEEVVRNAKCPVMTMHDEESGPVQLDSIKRILVPIDFSEHSELALVHAKEIADVSGAVLDLLHVVHVPSYPTLNDTGILSMYQYQPDVGSKAREHLAMLYGQSAGPDVKVNFTILHGLAPDEIIEYAREKKSDLIVMGTHGLTGLSHFLLGSIAAKTIRRAPCPMFIVKSFGKFLVDVDENQESATVKPEA